jgi:hypothetical protein
MSHADPKTWYSLPLEAQGYGQVLGQEVEVPGFLAKRWKSQLTSSVDHVHSEDWLAVSNARLQTR